MNHLEAGRWMRAHGFGTKARLKDREALFDRIAGIVADRQVLYLEFGVFQGESMRYWSSHLKHPGAHLHGFDSFEGLPENWNIRKAKGEFDTGGVVPETDDPRVRFFKGWFQDTLPRYVAPDHEVLLVNIDCDLYSSTIFVLRGLRNLMKAGTYIYFDEFYDRAHEMRAFDEFLNETPLKFRLACADLGLVRTVFECVA